MASNEIFSNGGDEVGTDIGKGDGILNDGASGLVGESMKGGGLGSGAGDNIGEGGDSGSDGECIWGSGEDHEESGDDGVVDIARSLATSASNHTDWGDLLVGKATTTESVELGILLLLISHSLHVNISSHPPRLCYILCSSGPGRIWRGWGLKSRLPWGPITSPSAQDIVIIALFEDYQDIRSQRACITSILSCLEAFIEGTHTLEGVVSPPSPDYVPGPEEPEQALPSPDYVPGPEHTGAQELTTLSLDFEKPLVLTVGKDGDDG
ncbi:hypothetical protein Tco_0353195, partial [Tanacetum coccineum]